MSPQKNLAGCIFGRLTVRSLSLEEPITFDATGRPYYKGRRWICQCECGKEIVTRADKLLSGRTMSCGCFHTELRKANIAEKIRLSAWRAQIKQGLAACRTAYNFFPSTPRKTGPDAHHALPAGTYERLLAEQGRACGICGLLPKGGRLVLDHDHATAQVRGLLCSNCNTGLGMFADDILRLAKAMKYLTTIRPVLLARNGRGL